MSDQTPNDLSDDDFLAAEYVLGTLDGAARLRAERRIRQDALFARDVAEWEERLSPMLSAVAPVAPPDAVWSAVEADLARIARVRAHAPASSASAPQRSTGRQVSGFWQWFGLGSFALLTASVAALFVLAQPLPQPAPMTASISAEGGSPLYTAVVYPGLSSATLVRVSAGSADPQHSHELWLIEGEKPPRSLGVLQSGGALRIDIPAELLAGGGVLAITLEPAGGSPTGKPTGPVVGKGELQAI